MISNNVFARHKSAQSVESVESVESTLVLTGIQEAVEVIECFLLLAKNKTLPRALFYIANCNQCCDLIIMHVF
jgi:hypothetical protein